MGHGPHVPRALEVYKEKVIVYSLGNFATYGRFSLSGWKQLAPAVELNFNDSLQITAVTIHSFIQKENGRPFKDPDSRAFLAIKEASIHDFPSSSWRFENISQIKMKP